MILVAAGDAALTPWMERTPHMQRARWSDSAARGVSYEI
jgi:hypothetical protein